VSIVAWLVIGAIAGYAANFLLGTRSGVIMTVAFGILGAIVGGLVGSFLTGGGFDLNKLMGEFDLTSIIVAIIGAVGLGAVGGWWNKRQAA
jgi:uncharacterized membrane protein YeaQ/YmgE (transglycosylase-associated protein family)